MKYLFASDGTKIAVDDEDHFILCPYKFTNVDNRIQIRTGPYRHRYLARVIAEFARMDTSKLIDHKDRDHTNNQRNNLRPATYTQNNQNSRKHQNNKSGYKGIRKHRNRYESRINVNGKSIFLGSFISPETAHIAYCQAAKKYFGEFANCE